MTTLEDLLADSPAVRAARAAAQGDAWIVGGAVRDAVLGRPVVDLDIAVPEGERALATRIADSVGGDRFRLSGDSATWRALAPGREWHVDATRLRGATIEADLGDRDFSVNAVAVPLAGGEPLDPHGGLADAKARVLRAVSGGAFAADPLRLLRAARIAANLGFRIEEGTIELARRDAGLGPTAAGERQLAELKLMLTGPHPVAAVELMAALGLTAHVLPELEAMREIEQTPYHHLDAHGHTLEVLGRAVELDERLEELFGEHATAVSAHLDRPLADEMDRRGGLRFGALFHDLGKPATRTVNEEGRVLFMGHDRVGAELIGAICRRLRTSRKLERHLQSLTLHHLRLGFMVHRRPLSRRDVYEYLRATDPVCLDVTLLTVADRLATRGPRTRDEAIEAHLELAREMVPEALAWHRDGPPAPPVRGHDLAAELGLDEGPELGRAMEELTAAAFAGEISSREEAVAHARRFL